jgi:hypothetical protein
MTREETPFDALSDDVLDHILLYCPFPSAVRFAKGTCRSLRQRFNNNTNEEESSSSQQCCRRRPLWKAMYHRHGFCPPEEEEEGKRSDYYLTLCREKRQLLSNLAAVSRKENKKPKLSNATTKRQRRCHPFSLPNRYFCFLPIVPTLNDADDEDYPNMMDPPPVFYECDSFVLTGCGTSPELLLLDPFDGSLRVLRDCLQHNTSVLASEEPMMERAWTSAGTAVHPHQGQEEEHQQQQSYNKLLLAKDDEAHLAGVAIEDAIASNHCQHEQPPPPTQCLLQGDEYFELDITQFFPHYRPDEEDDTIRSMATTTQEFEMSFVGTEAKPIWKVEDDGDIKSLDGYMVGIGRCVTSLGQDSVACTELTTWTRSTAESTYGNRRLCRLPWAFHLVDMDPCHQRIFASFPSGSGPDGSSKTISVYPLVNWLGEDAADDGRSATSSYFPKQLLSLKCQHPISTFQVDATGQTLLIATTQGTLEVWKVSKTLVPHRQHRFLLLKRFRSSIDKELTRRTQPNGDKDEDTLSTNPLNNDDDPLSDVSSRFSVLRRQPELAQFHAPVQTIFLPKHLPVEQAGFVTLQHSREEGSSLLVWKVTKGDGDNDDSSWEIISLIHLRLSSRRKPRISYDGNRILVFGEDHIGPIILVYQVRSAGGWEYDDDPDVSQAEEDDSHAGEASGGVYHLTKVPVVRFANRIRHVALGGIDAMDSMHMTCNERFLIVNTRTGNHLGSSPFSEGLLVIDLQDHSHHC